MKYVYPALITPVDDGAYDVKFPDLPGCRTFGNDLPEAIEMAEDALSTWLWDAENSGSDIPVASTTIAYSQPQLVSFVKADTDEYRRKLGSQSVKKTLTIPSWLNYEAEQANVNFSGILQEALKKHLHIDE